MAAIYRAPNGTPLKPTLMTLEPHLRDKLARIAQARGVSKTVIVRELIRQAPDPQGQPVKKQGA